MKRKIKVCRKCESCNKYPTKSLGMSPIPGNEELIRQDKKYGMFHGCTYNSSLDFDCTLKIPSQCKYKLEHKILQKEKTHTLNI